MNEKFADKTNEQLEQDRAEAKASMQPLFALTSPTAAQVSEANGFATLCREIDTELADRATAAAEFAANKDTDFSASTVAAAEEPEPEADPEPEPEPEPEADPEPEVEAAVEPEVDVPVKTSTVAKVAANSTQAKAPALTRGRLSIVAAADTGFAAGSNLDLSQITQGVINRLQGMPEPQGTGFDKDGNETFDIRKFGVATISKPFPEDLIIDRKTDSDEVIQRAANESRLPGGSLVASLMQRVEAADRGELESMVASNGWCSPSETMYDLVTDETLEGILSLPEVQIRRGGVRFTRGPQFSDFYSNAGFIQTEAQAIAGTTKPCYEVTCPTFVDNRLDAVGLCIKVPILLNAAYPEMTQRFTSGTLIAHEHMKNANIIGRIVTDAGAARVFAGLGSAVSDALEALALAADQRRQTYRLSLTHSLEVVVPFWLKEVYRSDLGRRMGVATEAITDAMLMAHFAVRNLAVSFVYDWQVLDPTVEVYPTTYQVLIYPAGTYVVGRSNVINLSAVYDAASLATNTYTGLFVEEGLLVMRPKFGSDLLTLPVCTAGRVGAANLTCS